MTFEFKLPDIGEGIAEGEIVQWHVKPGDTVREDQTLLEVMTDKVTAEIPSPRAGVVKALFGKAGEVVKVGSVIVAFEDGAGATTSKPAETRQELEAETGSAVPENGKPPAVATAEPAGTAGGSEKVLAAPATRKLARELGIDLTMITGSGPRGRVVPADVKQASQGGVTAPTATPVRRPAAQPIAPAAEDRRVPFAGMRRQIGEHLSKSKLTAPHFAYVDEVDMSELVRVRKELKEMAEAQGTKLTYLPFIIKAVISGLKAFPSLNSQLDETTGELVYKGAYNMGVAVATDAGLIVPVVKNADRKSLFDLAAEIAELSEKARTNKLALNDVKGGTFTLTSIGSIGGLFGLPIINLPEVAIMGINKISQRPVARDGQIVIREMMYLSLSCDHRVVDGAEAARFVNHVIEQLEKPSRLLLS